jgi:6-phosphogluconolactonase
MTQINRRAFLCTASASALVSALAVSDATRLLAAPSAGKQRVLVGSGTVAGVLSFAWDSAKGELTAEGSVAALPNATWLAFSADHKVLFVATEADAFHGKPAGGLSSFRIAEGKLAPISAVNSAGPGTCHCALDHSGRVLLSADYGGGSAASFLVSNGQLSPAVWTEHYTGHGPNTDRQQTAHAHFTSFSPDNRFAYINDLGGDCIHIYGLNSTTAALTPAGVYRSHPGAGPRTLHFHPNGHTAYVVNELNSTVDVVEWKPTDGSLAFVSRIALLPDGYTGPTRACDTVITKDGRFVYFANRDNDFLYSFRADPKSGALTPMGRTPCGGKIPRNFTLDPTERWMLVANQDSSLVSVFARNPLDGTLAREGKSIAAPAPMCILFV